MLKTAWGRWTFNPDNGCLETTIAPATGAGYQVPLYEMDTSAATLDWIYQVAEKTWATPADVGDLVSAIVELLGRGVASGGKDTPIEPRTILEHRYGNKSS